MLNYYFPVEVCNLRYVYIFQPSVILSQFYNVFIPTFFDLRFLTQHFERFNSLNFRPDFENINFFINQSIDHCHLR